MGDFYSTLGVSKNADAKEIKSAYRKVAMKFHPDKNPGNSVAEEKFKAAAEAYSVLSDEQKRARYDQFGHSAYTQSGGGSGGRGGFQHMDMCYPNQANPQQTREHGAVTQHVPKSSLPMPCHY